MSHVKTQLQFRCFNWNCSEVTENGLITVEKFSRAPRDEQAVVTFMASCIHLNHPHFNFVSFVYSAVCMYPAIALGCCIDLYV